MIIKINSIRSLVAVNIVAMNRSVQDILTRVVFFIVTSLTSLVTTLLWRRNIPNVKMPVLLVIKISTLFVMATNEIHFVDGLIRIFFLEDVACDVVDTNDKEPSNGWWRHLHGSFPTAWRQEESFRDKIGNGRTKDLPLMTLSSLLKYRVGRAS